MKVNNCFEIILTLSNKDLRGLKRLILAQSTVNERALAIVDVVLGRRNKNLTAQQLQAYVAKKTGDSRDDRRVWPQLSNLAEHYIIQHILPTNNFINDRHQIELATFYFDKGLTHLSEKKAQEHEEKIEAKKHPNYRDFYLHYQLSMLQVKNSLASENRIGDSKLPSVHSHFDTFYIMRKLMLACFSLNRQTVVQHTDSNNTILDSILTDEVLNELCKNLLFDLWHKAYQLLKFRDNEHHYNNLKQTIKNNYAVFTEDEISPLFYYLINAAALLYKGKAFYEEALQIYETQAEYSKLLVGTYLTTDIYKNMITVCLKLDKIKQAKQILEAYKHDLPELNKVAYYQYNKATILFAENKFNAALDLLLALDLDDVYYMLGAKRFICMIYYQIDEIDVLESYLNAFRVYIYRLKGKMAANRHEAHKYFINTLNKICYLKPKEWRRKQKLIEKVESYKFISERQWLIDKLQEI